jgi:hypothetical protein
VLEAVGPWVGAPKLGRRYDPHDLSLCIENRHGDDVLYFDLGSMERMERSHAVIVTPLGRRGFQETFGIDASEPGERGKN